MAATTSSSHHPSSTHLPESSSSITPSAVMASTAAATSERPHSRRLDPLVESLDSPTPTRDTFGGMSDQRPLPSSPFQPSDMVDTPPSERPTLDREDSVRSQRSKMTNNSEDVDMADDDDLDDENEEHDSDNDSASSDPQRPRKKKKGQRFFCTDFAPCNLSFTRSEHLARHIRKHTGERPFKCHCNRRFSRLDNLRQHAQTVHVNEDIPGDSLAATGTRFQRQIRTDRVTARSAAPGRSRAGTGASIGHPRNHSRTVSSSSIASIASNASTLPDEARRRPPTLAMATGPPPRQAGFESYGPPPNMAATQYAYYPQSPGYTASNFSTGGNSPRFPMQSPNMVPRGVYYPQPQLSARRLSVPSIASPHPNAPNMYPSTYFGPQPGAVFHGHSASISSSVASPYPPSIYTHSRRESEAELEWRRRTWHPGTYASHVSRPATSGLMYQQTPDDARPTTAGNAAASQMTRLPGIESFDQKPLTAPVPAQRSSSPMQLDNTGRPPIYPGTMDAGASGPGDHRRTNSGWESSLHQNLNRLDIKGSNLHAPASRSYQRAPLPTFTFPQAPPEADSRQAKTSPSQGDADNLGISNRRHGWYGAPANPSGGPSQPISIMSRASPDASGSSDGLPTPSTSQGHEAHPSIHRNGAMDPRSNRVDTEDYQQHDVRESVKPGAMRFDSGSHVYGHAQTGSAGNAYILQPGYDPRSPQMYQQPAPRPTSDMGRLEALVAVATSENAR